MRVKLVSGMAGYTVSDITFARPAQAGVPEQVVMQWLGHRDSQMVRHYYHLHNDEVQRQMQRVTFVGGSGVTSAPEGTTDTLS